MKTHGNHRSPITPFANELGNPLGFVLVLMLASSTLWGKAPRESASLTVSVYNEAGVPEDVLSQGEQEASLVFQQAGIEVRWLDCSVPAENEQASSACREAVFPEHLHLTIARKSFGLKGETMGIAFQAENGSGCYADLFYEPMEKLHKSYQTKLASLLGHAAAHEIGHLLLGTNSHSVAGIMHAHWTAAELVNTSVGRLVFLDTESRRMKARLLAGHQLSAKLVSMGESEVSRRPVAESYAVFNATPAQEAALHSQMLRMHPEVPPRRIIFVPHWKYVDNARIFRLSVPRGYTSLMFTHLPSRTVFIDVDRYITEDSLGYWFAHELGHLVTNSVKEADAERAAAEYRKRLKMAPWPSS